MSLRKAAFLKIYWQKAYSKKITVSRLSKQLTSLHFYYALVITTEIYNQNVSAAPLLILLETAT
jgi:hypothetical protein